MNKKCFFINENYDWMPDLLIEEDGLGPIMAEGIHLSLDRPVRYRASELPSSCAKSFYDLEALIVNPEIANCFEEMDPEGLYLVPISITFSDGVTLPYYRLDTRLEHDVIDYNRSVPLDGDPDVGYSFKEIVLDQQKIERLDKSEPAFFRLKGLQIIQYMINEDLKKKLDSLNHHIVISDESSYKGI